MQKFPRFCLLLIALTLVVGCVPATLPSRLARTIASLYPTTQSLYPTTQSSRVRRANDPLP